MRSADWEGDAEEGTRTWPGLPMTNGKGAAGLGRVNASSGGGRRYRSRARHEIMVNSADRRSPSLTQIGPFVTVERGAFAVGAHWQTAHSQKFSACQCHLRA